MRVLLSKAHHNPRYSKIIQWGKLISITGSAQIVVQGLGLISGIFIIRLLPTQEYALYTLVNTMLGTMTVLSDGGISAGVMAQGGKVWQDRDKLGTVLVTGFSLRKKFAIASLVIVIPILYYLLVHNHAGYIEAALIVICLIPAFVAALSDSLLEVAPKLQRDITPLQKNQVAVSVLRVIMLATLLVSPFSAVAIIAAGIPRIWGNLQLRKISSRYANWKSLPDVTIQKEMLSVVKRILPGAIYYCVSGQITVWIISIFGNSTSIAQVGALGRISMMLNVLNIVIATLIIPSFSKVKEHTKPLIKNFIKIQLGLVIICVLIVGLIYLFPTQVLWLLGKSYGTLKIALVLSILGSCISLMGGVSFGLFTSRGWAINPIFSIPINIASIILGVMFIKVYTVQGALEFNIFIALVQYVMNSVYCVFKILKIKS